MKPIEPGDTFTIEYGCDHRIEVVALNMRQKRKVMGIVDEVSEIEAASSSRAKLFDLAEEALKICVPSITEEQIDTIDEIMAMEIIGATLSKQGLSNDEEKKSESQP